MKSIAVKLLKTVFSLYIIVTVLSTCVHIYFDYSQRKAELLKELENIQVTFAPTLANSLWDFNKQQTIVSAEGIESLENITAVEVVDEDEGVIYRSQSLESTDLVAGTALSQSYKLYQVDDEGERSLVGEITLYSDRKFVFARVQLSVLIIIANACVKTGFLWLLFLLAFKKYLKEPLGDLSHQAGDINFSPGKNSQIKLKNSEYTELNILQTSINDLLSRLNAAMDDLHSLNGSLEDKVRERTSELEEKNEMLILAKNETDRANRVKGDFIANVSHELRTPLNAIIGFTEVLQRENGNEENAYQYEAVLASSASLLRIINDILDITKVERGSLSLHVEVVNLLSILEQTYQNFKGEASKKSLALSLSLPDDFEPCVSCDETRLRQILNNLLENAIKFTNEGRVEMILEQEIHGSFADIKLTVRDTGFGVPLAIREKIFEPFEQNSEQSNKFGGTGLGLAISRKIANLLGGDLSLEDCEGQGACFVLDLKGLAVNISDVEEESKTELVFEECDVLLVDDLELNHSVSSEMLKGSGLKLRHAYDAKEALEQLDKYDIKLVLMDFKLKDGDGLSLAKDIKSYKELTVVALSASAMLEDEAELSLGCDAYLRKPLSREKLLRELSRFLEAKEFRKIEPEPGKLEFSELEIAEVIQEFINYEPLMQKFLESMTINDVQEIAVSVKKLCKKTPLPELLLWRSRFQEAYENFDMIELSEIFRGNQGFIETLQRLKNS